MESVRSLAVNILHITYSVSQLAKKQASKKQSPHSRDEDFKMQKGESACSVTNKARSSEPHGRLNHASLSLSHKKPTLAADLTFGGIIC